MLPTPASCYTWLSVIWCLQIQTHLSYLSSAFSDTITNSRCGTPIHFYPGLCCNYVKHSPRPYFWGSHCTFSPGLHCLFIWFWVITCGTFSQQWWRKKQHHQNKIYILLKEWKKLQCKLVTDSWQSLVVCLLFCLCWLYFQRQAKGCVSWPVID